MIDLIAEQLLHCADNFLAAGDHAVDVVAGMVPERQVRPPALGVFDVHRGRLHAAVRPGRGDEQGDCFGVEEFVHEQVAVILKLSDLLGRKRAVECRGHGWLLGGIECGTILV